MNQSKYIYVLCLTALICAAGCGDNAATSDAEVEALCHPECVNHQVCRDGRCVDDSNSKSDADVCTAPACLDEYTYCKDGSWLGCSDGTFCVDGECQPGEDKNKCTTGSCREDGQALCVDGVWQPCEDEEICVDGECRLSETSECSPGICSEDGVALCQDDGHYEACGTGWACVQKNGTSSCVSQRKQDPATLWTICDTDRECGQAGVCLFSVSTSDGRTIPVSSLDKRLAANEGICSFDCTANASSCGKNGQFVCQLVEANVTGVYPPKNPSGVVLDLPFAEELGVPASTYAALCRPVIQNESDEQDESGDQEETYYKSTFCKPCDEQCSDDEVCIDGICTITCKNESQCPLAFQCVERDGQKVCVPPTGVCGDWLDHDGDGQGWGHCVEGSTCDNVQYDCDDTNAMYYSGRDIDPQKSVITIDAGTALTCDRYNDGYLSDFNCNGLIDRNELLGTVNHCSACGDVCATDQDAKTAHMQTQCVASTNEASPGTFECQTPCDFGYADCDGIRANGCEVKLYENGDRNILPVFVDYEQDMNHFYVDPEKILEGAEVYLRDDDKDKAYRLEEYATKEEKRPLLDPRHTQLCCKTGNTDLCYAPKNWKIEQKDKSLSRFASELDMNSLSSFETERNDSIADYHPGSGDRCDGNDNDSSKIALSADAESCQVYCKTHNCNSFRQGDGYVTNGKCDATPDGSTETLNGYQNFNVSEVTLKLFDTCSLVRIDGNGNSTVCSTNGTVQCIPSMGVGSGLTCIDDSSRSTLDGSDEAHAFDGIDEDCDGRVDEDDYRPCVITGNNSYEVVTSKDYNYDGLNGSLLNPDGSINVCRLGYMTGRNICTRIDAVRLNYANSYYDLYGDGIDADCDGYDFDLDKAVFVDFDRGTSTSGNDNHSGTYNSPVASLKKAMELANANKSDNSKFRDIIIAGSSSSDVISVSETIVIPTSSKQDAFYNLRNLPNISTESDYEQYKIWYVHQWLAEQRRDGIQDLYRFESSDRKEVNKPQELIRFYGGFEHELGSNSNAWISSNIQTKLLMTVKVSSISNDAASGSYPHDARLVMMSADPKAPLSLKLQNLDIQLSADSANLPENLVNGLTLIGIDASLGAEVLNMNHSKITVNAPNGYSFDSKNDAQSGRFEDGGKHGHDGKSSYSSLNSEKVFNCYQSYFGKSPDDINKSGFPTAAHVAGFNQTYDGACTTVNHKDAFCYYETPETSSISSKTGWGGVGGIADSSSIRNVYEGQKGQASADGTAGGAGCKPNSLNKNNFDTVFKEIKCGTLACGKDSEPDVYSGMPGQNGASGANGVQPADLSYQFGDHALYIYSDRTLGHGAHGAAGGGGGGGGVANAAHKGTDEVLCAAGCGGDGGCGGNGGRAGGTGASAIGIVLKANSTQSDNVNIQLNDSTIEVHAGNGGIGQNGGSGMPGGHGGQGETEQWKESMDKTCVSRAGGPGGGGGGGGAGAGGRAGLANPLVLITTKTTVCSEHDNWASSGNTMSWCGFDLTFDSAFEKAFVINKPFWYGTSSGQYSTGTIQYQNKSCSQLCLGTRNQNTIDLSNIENILCSFVDPDTSDYDNECTVEYGELLRINGRAGMTASNVSRVDPAAPTSDSALNDVKIKRLVQK